MIIGNILPGVSSCCCQFVGLSRTLEAPPKVLYSVVHVVFRTLELPREACGSTCGRLQSLEFGLVGTFSKNHGRPERRKSQPFLQMVLNKRTPILAYVVKRKTIFTLSTYSFICLLQFWNSQLLAQWDNSESNPTTQFVWGVGSAHNRVT
jgi:hypothetical protein